MFDVDSITPFLVERGLIDHTWIIEGDLVVRAAVHRNRNLRIEGPGGAGYMIKQPGEPGSGSDATLRCEAEFHRHCREEPAMGPLARNIPPLIGTIVEHSILIFELIPGAIPLRRQIEIEEGRGGTVESARQLGRVLGTLHRVSSLPVQENDSRLTWLPRALPWAMRLHEPRPAHLAGLSPANLDLIRVLQTQEGLRERLDALRGRCRPDCIIHGDIRFDNVLVRPRRESWEPGSTGPWVVDWEMIGVGDPAWDLAGALQSFLVSWVSSMPLSEELAAEDMSAQARIPLSGLRDAMRALWSGYRREVGLGSPAADDRLSRAVAFSAARLIQTVFELLDGADRLAGPAVLLLQIAANLLADPEGGQFELYGISSGSAAP